MTYQMYILNKIAVIAGICVGTVSTIVLIRSIIFLIRYDKKERNRNIFSTSSYGKQQVTKKDKERSN